jgi:8-oxo-dGTP pyrophosphatase MutT (NUDIX family)
MGRPGPWEEISVSSVTVADVIKGMSAHGLEGPPKRSMSARDADVEILDGLEARGDLRHSAVLIALFEEEGQARVILTRRSTALSSHSGEVSFPGGRMEPGEGPVDAALREAFEEIGLEPTRSRIVGHLHPIVTLVSRSLIQPVVAVLESRPTMVADPREVERAFDVPLVDLVAPGVFHEERWRRPERPSPKTADGSFPLWFFEISGEMVWGATGRLLVDLLCLALGIEGAPDR